MASHHRAVKGFTLAEMLVVVSLLAILAAVALPSLGTLDNQRLEVAANEVRTALRLARSEALRLDTNVVVDMGSTNGHVKLHMGGCGNSGTAIVDPRTKLAFEVDVADGPYAGGVTLTPQFLAGGSAYSGLVFASSGVPSDVCQFPAASSQGTPQAGSQVLLSYGGKQVAVSIDPATGRVWGP